MRALVLAFLVACLAPRAAAALPGACSGQFCEACEPTATLCYHQFTEEDPGCLDAPEYRSDGVSAEIGDAWAGAYYHDGCVWNPWLQGNMTGASIASGDSSSYLYVAWYTADLGGINGNGQYTGVTVYYARDDVGSLGVFWTSRDHGGWCQLTIVNRIGGSTSYPFDCPIPPPEPPSIPRALP